MRSDDPVERVNRFMKADMARKARASGASNELIRFFLKRWDEARAIMKARIAAGEFPVL